MYSCRQFSWKFGSLSPEPFRLCEAATTLGDTRGDHKHCKKTKKLKEIAEI